MSTLPSLSPTDLIIGIDVAERTLEIAVPAWQRTWQVPNTAAGHQALLDALLAEGGEPSTWIVVLEPTGGWELSVAWHLQAVGARIDRVNPQTARELRTRLKTRAKTDRLDAEALALVPTLGVRCAPLPSPVRTELQGLLHHRATLVDTDTQIQLRQRAPHLPALVVAQLAEQRQALKGHRRACEVAIAEAVAAEAVFAADVARLRTVPGIGEWTATELVAACPLLGTGQTKAVASYVGVAPHAAESGRLTRPRRISGGHARLRSLLYMATLSAMSHNPIIAAFAARLRAKGKRGKVVIVACMHKLLRLADQLLTHGRDWSPTPLTT